MRTCLTTTHLRMKLHKSLQNQLHHQELENEKVFHARVLMKTSYYHHQMGTSLFQNQELTDHLKYKMHEDHLSKPTRKPPPVPHVEEHITNVPVPKIKELN